MRPEERNYAEVDLLHLGKRILHRIWVVLLAPVVAGVIAMGMTLLLVEPQYEAKLMFYVNSTEENPEEMERITSTDLMTARSLVDSYIVVLTTRETLLEVTGQAGIQRSCRELEEMIRAEAVNSTEMFRVVVTSRDPYEAERIAMAIEEVLPRRIGEILPGVTAAVADPAAVGREAEYPDYEAVALWGAGAGLALVLLALFLEEMFCDVVRCPGDIQKACGAPFVVAVPGREGKGGLAAFKQLRTKLRLSFPEGEECRVLGISSAQAGAGKSRTAVRLARELGLLGAPVLLIDCDLLSSSLRERLPVQESPGLSEFLEGGKTLRIQRCGKEKGFDVLACGRRAEDPAERLSSERFAGLLTKLRQRYAWIVLDLPPLGEDGAALAVSRSLDGYLLAVRQERCSRRALSEAAEQTRFAQTRIVGAVLYER